MTAPDVDWSTLTDDELAQCQLDISAEQEQRSLLVYIPQQIAALNQEYLDAEGTEPGEPWRQPQGAHDAYPKDWVVTHQDKTWASLVDANVWEPPTNWREQTVEGQYPEWVQPMGAQDAYNKGDRVHYTPLDGDYESVIDANTWSPQDYPAGWTRL